MHYGYIAVLIGCILEGETFAILGGIAANHGLSLPMVYLVSFVGAWLCDSILFLLGHHYGPAILKRLSKYQNRVDKIEYWVRKYDFLAIIGLRFLYGFRTIGPIAVGVVGVNSVRFIICNAVGAALWSSIFVTVGYSASRIFSTAFYKISNNILYVFICIAIIFIGVRIIQLIMSYYNRR